MSAEVLPKIFQPFYRADKHIYLDRLMAGESLESIDNMDFFCYLDLLAYKANKDENKEINRTTIENLI